jgi:ankyrin repeat protein
VRLTALQLAATGEYRFVPLLLPYFQPPDIFHAAAVADADRVEELLKQDKSLANAIDANRWRPLHYCCASAAYKLGRAQSDALVRIARRLIDRGADPSATWLFDDKWPLTAMYHCTGQQDHAALAEVLLDAGAVPFDGESVFHAADEGHRASLELFERRCDAKRLAEECTRALRTLMHWGRVRGVPWLLAHGADANSIHAESGDAPLHSAVKQRSNDRIIRLLLEHGANPRLKNKSGKTAIELARASSASDRLLPLLSKKN